MANHNDDEPIIEVTATPVGGQPSTQVFPYSTESTRVSGSTVPQVAGERPGTAIQVAAQFLDDLKGRYNAEKYDLVVEVDEEEEVDRGWFSHTDVGGGIDFESGKWEAKIKGTPKKVKKTKKTIVRIGLEEKGK